MVKTLFAGIAFLLVIGCETLSPSDCADGGSRTPCDAEAQNCAIGFVCCIQSDAIDGFCSGTCIENTCPPSFEG